MARDACAHSYNSSLRYDSSRPEPQSRDINYNALPEEKYGDGNAGCDIFAGASDFVVMSAGFKLVSPLVRVSRPTSINNITGIIFSGLSFSSIVLFVIVYVPVLVTGIVLAPVPTPLPVTISSFMSLRPGHALRTSSDRHGVLHPDLLVTCKWHVLSAEIRRGVELQRPISFYTDMSDSWYLFHTLDPSPFSFPFPSLFPSPLPSPPLSPFPLLSPFASSLLPSSLFSPCPRPVNGPLQRPHHRPRSPLPASLPCPPPPPPTRKTALVQASRLANGGVGCLEASLPTCVKLCHVRHVNDHCTTKIMCIMMPCLHELSEEKTKTKTGRVIKRSVLIHS